MRTGDLLCGRYVVHEPIGQGGMATVYRAEELALARTVAVKILHTHHVHAREVVDAFREEAVAASRVRHPGCVTIIERNRLADGTPLIVMEYIPGRSLSRVIAEEPLPVARALEMITQILSAIDAVHTSGLVHADVKSDNILVETISGRDHLTLIDFGLARPDGTPATAGVVSGTPEYMAPELIRGGAPTRASDLYAAGVILYELLTGSPPFAAHRISDVLTRHLEDIVVPPSLRAPAHELPAALDHIVLRALDKHPEARFTDAEEMLRALRGLARAVDDRSHRVAHWEHAAGGDSPTRNCNPDIPRQRLARGSEHTIGELERLRSKIGAALTNGDVAAIERGYIALAEALVRGHHFAAAARELEEGIAVLGNHDATERLEAELVALRSDANRRRTWRFPAAQR